MNERGLRVRFIQWSESVASTQQDRLRKRSLTIVVVRKALARSMWNLDNTITGSRLKAQGKSIIQPALTGSPLRSG